MKELVEEIVESCVNLATEKSGCCVLQQCILHAKEEHKGRLIAEIVTNALVLSDHPYGYFPILNFNYIPSSIVFSKRFIIYISPLSGTMLCSIFWKSIYLKLQPILYRSLPGITSLFHSASMRAMW